MKYSSAFDHIYPPRTPSFRDSRLSVKFGDLESRQSPRYVSLSNSRTHIPLIKPVLYKHKGFIAAFNQRKDQSVHSYTPHRAGGVFQSKLKKRYENVTDWFHSCSRRCWHDVLQSSRKLLHSNGECWHRANTSSVAGTTTKRPVVLQS